MSDVTCECGERFTAHGLKNHQRGEPHRCRMTEVVARSRGCYVIIGSGHFDRYVKSLCALGFESSFALVEKHFPSKVNKEGRVIREAYTQKIWNTTPEMYSLLCAYASQHDDMPENTMHAALVFASVYEENVANIVIGLVNFEIGSPSCSANITRHASGLMSVLRANGVSQPARTLANLFPHLLFAAAESLRAP